MKRRSFTLLSFISLLLFLATTALWVRSYGPADSFWRQQPRYAWRQISAHGQFGILWVTVEDPALANTAIVTLSHDQFRFGPQLNALGRGMPRRFNAVGFSWYGPGGPAGTSWRLFITPIWFVWGLLMLLPWRWWVMNRRGRRQWKIEHEICLKCGYDLRATPGRCPECGTRARGKT
ncbi:MAG TPA: hypothetical protein VG269_22905 [Tepidisphaeraceae bacterium]|nr:hypothetical protein [Tepidisphaeraceae bacterium]